MGRLSAAFRASIGPVSQVRDPAMASWFGLDGMSDAGVSVTPDSALKFTAVYRAVQVLSQTYASLPLSICRIGPNGEKTPDRAHPLWCVLVDRPNRWQTSYEWREMMAAHFALRNRCYSEIVSTGGRGVSELIPLHPDRVRPFFAPDGNIAFEYRPNDGPSRVILAREMHWMHGPALGEDGCTPLSPIAVSRNAIGLALAAEGHAARLFGNGTWLGGVLKMKSHLRDDAARAKLLASWRAAYSGIGNSGKTALLEDGLEWQSLGMTLEDAQYVAGRNFQVAEASRIFGVPVHMLSSLERSTNNNIEHQGIEFVAHTIRPGAVRREEALARDLLTGGTHCVYFDLDGLQRGDMAARAAYNASLIQNGVITRNEARVDEGMNPSADPGMDRYTVQVNMSFIDELGSANAGQ